MHINFFLTELSQPRVTLYSKYGITTVIKLMFLLDLLLVKSSNSYNKIVENVSKV